MRFVVESVITGGRATQPKPALAATNACNANAVATAGVAVCEAVASGVCAAIVYVGQRVDTGSPTLDGSGWTCGLCADTCDARLSSCSAVGTGRTAFRVVVLSVIAGSAAEPEPCGAAASSTVADLVVCTARAARAASGRVDRGESTDPPTGSHPSGTDAGSTSITVLSTRAGVATAAAMTPVDFGVHTSAATTRQRSRTDTRPTVAHSVGGA